MKKIMCVCVCVASTAPDALAACPSTPYNYSAASCGGYCAAVSGTLTCSVASASGPSEVVVVTDYTSDSNFEAWGYDSSSSTGLFCCSIATSGISTVVIEGGDSGDSLRFEWAAHTYNLTAPNNSQILGQINGNDGNDLIRGADDSAGYTEQLNGNDFPDTIVGGGGADTISGGSGDDVLNGGGGDDVMDGGSGDDIIIGGLGDDVMDGGDGNDSMSGNTGDDDMDGGAHRDLLCGGNDAGDVLDDGDTSGVTVDRLYGANASATLICQHSSTAVDTISNPGVCTNIVLTSEPADCP